LLRDLRARKMTNMFLRAEFTLQSSPQDTKQDTKPARSGSADRSIRPGHWKQDLKILLPALAKILAPASKTPFASIGLPPNASARDIGAQIAAFSLFPAGNLGLTDELALNVPPP